jgi:hypothetical protein
MNRQVTMASALAIGIFSLSSTASSAKPKVYGYYSAPIIFYFSPIAPLAYGPFAGYSYSPRSLRYRAILQRSPL